ncbi:MAG: hypothetical protein QW757_00135 [Candidatus Woesearchaeota archaeon]
MSLNNNILNKKVEHNIIEEIKKLSSISKKESYNSLNENDANFIFSDSGKKIKIDKNNFYDVFFEKKNMQEKTKNKKIAFIDGGSCEILKSNLLAVYFYRIYYTIYENNKRIKNNFFEFYSYIYPIIKYEQDEKKIIEKENVFFKCEIFYLNENKKILGLNKNFLFDGFDKKISMNNKITDVGLIGNIIRRFAELNIIKEIEADYVVLDGSFDINYPHEEEIIKELIEKNKNKKIIFGLSKTNSFSTEKGISFSYYIDVLARSLEKKTFLYFLDNNDFFNVFFIKTNEKSDYSFRLDLLNCEKENLSDFLKEIFFLLRENSKDPVFLGYPYGLIEADMFARISNKEKEQIMIRFLSLFGNEGKDIKKIVSLSRTHDVLDKIRF